MSAVSTNKTEGDENFQKKKFFWSSKERSDTGRQGAAGDNGDSLRRLEVILVCEGGLVPVNLVVQCFAADLSGNLFDDLFDFLARLRHGPCQGGGVEAVAASTVSSQLPRRCRIGNQGTPGACFRERPRSTKLR